MEKTKTKKSRFGLVGRNISYSFSKAYFTQKFSDLKLEGYTYENFDLEKIDGFQEIIKQNTNLKGLNVTIPYKESILPYLTRLDLFAAKIGAVNTIKIDDNGLHGYNTDAYGFRESIRPILRKYHKSALILGTGGASKAVAFALQELDIEYRFVSRNADKSQLSYQAMTKDIFREHSILINCTPLGTHPNIADKPPIPYHFLTKKHLLFDLIYNPEKTAFLKAGEYHGAVICNGLQMLQLQAEKAWEIWNT